MMLVLILVVALAMVLVKLLALVMLMGLVRVAANPRRAACIATLAKAHKRINYGKRW